MDDCTKALLRETVADHKDRIKRLWEESGEDKTQWVSSDWIVYLSQQIEELENGQRLPAQWKPYVDKLEKQIEELEANLIIARGYMSKSAAKRFDKSIGSR